MRDDPRSVDRRRREGRRALAGGLAVSLLVHLLVLFAWRVPAGAGTAAADREAGPVPRVEPRSGLRAVSVGAEAGRRAPAPEREERPALPEPQVRSAADGELALRRVEGGAAPRLPLRGSGDGAAGSSSGGASPGASGAGSGDSPPVPRSLLPEWSPPREVRGARVTVRVEVDARGRPTGDVLLDPPTASESFNRTLRRRMTSLDYLPARRDGEPVAGWAEITFVF